MGGGCKRAVVGGPAYRRTGVRPSGPSPNRHAGPHAHARTRTRTRTRARTRTPHPHPLPLPPPLPLPSGYPAARGTGGLLSGAATWRMSGSLRLPSAARRAASSSAIWLRSGVPSPATGR